MIKSMFKHSLLILSICTETSYVIGMSLKQISSLLLCTIKYQDREKWIIEKPSWIPSQKLKSS